MSTELGNFDKFLFKPKCKSENQCNNINRLRRRRGIIMKRDDKNIVIRMECMSDKRQRL
jgi:hypothetical protein